jgi:pimeloyl-ACP methyl ester carboxylesterase
VTIRNETLAAGARSIDVLIGGTSEGPALILHHGTPSDATLFSGWDEAARVCGLRLISISRPGYATSSRRRGRTVADVAEDVALVLDRFAVPWFVTAGWSGGGPHALATASLLGPRCRAAATLAGVGPYAIPDLDFLDGMGPENHAEFGAALRGEDALRTWLTENAADYAEVTGPELVSALGGLIPQVDKDALAGNVADAFAATTRRALAGGFDGWIDDDLAFIRPWGFALADVRVPVTIWQGDLDLMVPFAHAEWLRRQMPQATSHAAPGHGHISLVTTYRNAIVDDLLSRAGGPSPYS